MKHLYRLLTVGLLLFSFSSLFGQNGDLWLEEKEQRYSSELYFIGSASDEVPQEKLLSKVMEETKTRAQINLACGILSLIKSDSDIEIESKDYNGQIIGGNIFKHISKIGCNVKVIGTETELYYDEKKQIVYAFVYVERNKLVNYHKNNLTVNLKEIEWTLRTIQDLEKSGEKTEARRQCEAIEPLFVQVDSARSWLMTIVPGISLDDLQLTTTQTLKNTRTQVQIQLKRGALVYVESDEDLFGEKVNIVKSGLESELGKKDCIFVNDVEKADFKISINVSTKYLGNDSIYNLPNTVFCYAKAQVEFYNTHKKTTYRYKIEEKDGGVSQNEAGEKAMKNVAPSILKKIEQLIEN
jgi:hypothetical protein